MSNENNVVSMADAACDGTLWSQRQALECALEDVGKNGAFKKGKKLLIFALDESDGDYSVSFVQAGMKMSECVALCEVAKSVFLREMNY